MEINKDIVISPSASYNPQSTISSDGLTWSSSPRTGQCMRTNKNFEHKYSAYFEFKVLSVGDGLNGMGIGNTTYEVYGGRSAIRPTSCIYIDCCNYGNQVSICFHQSKIGMDKYEKINKYITVSSNWYGLGINLKTRKVGVYFNNQTLYETTIPSAFDTNDIMNRFFINMPWDGYQGSATFNFGKNGFKYEDTAKEYYFKDYNRLYDLEDNMYGNI